MSKQQITFLNPRTCGIYKNGGIRFKTDPTTGRRTKEIDNELIEAVDAYLAHKTLHGTTSVPFKEIFDKRILVPTYFDKRFDQDIRTILDSNQVDGVTLGELLAEGTLSVRGGHGSPGNDQRTGTIPYLKVSDIRGLRINVNPTNLVSESVARRFWRGPKSGLNAWDVITPNRASNNIGEFAMLLPGEEQVVLTKEMFVFRVLRKGHWDPFYLLWALSLRAVRNQWRRIALMQTNREDCGNRYREIIIPKPKSRSWARDVSQAFRDHFTTIANAKETFVASVTNDSFEYVASVVSALPVVTDNDSGKSPECPDRTPR